MNLKQDSSSASNKVANTSHPGLNHREVSEGLNEIGKERDKNKEQRDRYLNRDYEMTYFKIRFEISFLLLQGAKYIFFATFTSCILGNIIAYRQQNQIFFLPI